MDYGLAKIYEEFLYDKVRWVDCHREQDTVIIDLTYKVDDELRHRNIRINAYIISISPEKGEAVW